MKWILIVTVSVSSNGFGGPAVNTQRAGEFDTRQQCEIAGREFVLSHSGGFSWKAAYTCIQAR